MRVRREQCVYSSGAHCISIRMMRMCAIECECACRRRRTFCRTEYPPSPWSDIPSTARVGGEVRRRGLPNTTGYRRLSFHNAALQYNASDSLGPIHARTRAPSPASSPAPDTFEERANPVARRASTRRMPRELLEQPEAPPISMCRDTSVGPSLLTRMRIILPPSLPPCLTPSLPFLLRNLKDQKRPFR